jgi:hypothetical protein
VSDWLKFGIALCALIVMVVLPSLGNDDTKR